MDFDKVIDKKYHFEFAQKKRPAGYAPKVVVPDDQCLCFLPSDMYALRQAVKKYGRDMDLKRVEEFDDNLYEEMYEDLSDILYSNLASPLSNKELSDAINEAIQKFKDSDQGDAAEDALEQRLNELVPYELDDYKVVFPDELINDLLDDDFLDWRAIEDSIAESKRDAEEMLAEEKGNDDDDLPF